jgi:hypothetical protein
MSAQNFPQVSRFVRSLQSGLKQFGLADIFDLFFWRRADRDFFARTKKRAQELEHAVNEIQAAYCAAYPDTERPPDPGQIKSLLWDSIKQATRARAPQAWDADPIGTSVVERLRSVGEERVECIPLPGSIAPLRDAPVMHPLAEGVWLIEPCRSVERLLPKLEELVVPFSQEIRASLRAIGDDVNAGVDECSSGVRRSRESEYHNLLHEPLIACHAQGWFAERPVRLRTYGIPLIALHNLVTVNALDTSDSVALCEYLTKNGSPRWPEQLWDEWKSLCNPQHIAALNFGGIEPHLFASPENYCPQLAFYEIYPRSGKVSAVNWGFSPPAALPPILILPSLLTYEFTERLIEYGQRIPNPTASDLDRRIGHGLAMWTNACACAQQEELEVGFDFEPEHESLIMGDPDSVILYSTIVLETLFSSKTDKQEVTTRIADLTAGLLGTSAQHRYELSRKTKQGYAQRSEFVHGAFDRPSGYETTAMWLFKIATLALWEAVRLVVFEGERFGLWQDFCQYVERRKYGAHDA